MFDIALADHGFAQEPRRVSRGGSSHGERIGDRDHRLEPVSEAQHQRWTRMLVESDGVRWHRVRSVREAIASGGYMTEQRLDAAIDGLLAELD